MGDLLWDVLVLVIPILTAVIIAALGWLISWIKTKTSAIQIEVARDMLNSALDEASIVATDAVQATSQEYVDDIKAGREDGKLTDEEKHAAMQNAQDIFLGKISKNALSILQEAIGPVEQWLEDFLEGAVKRESPEE